MTARRKAITRSVLAFAWGLAAIVATPLSAGAEGGIDVVINQAKIVKLARPADTIVIGNPAIADASVKDSSTLVLTGKGFGVTNLVIMDEEGLPIVDEMVMVRRGDANSVQIYRRAELQTLSCSPTCEAAYKTDAEMANQ